MDGAGKQFDKHLLDGGARGERIATPVCALVRNDRLDTAGDRPISIYLTVVLTATPCVPLKKGEVVDWQCRRQFDKRPFDGIYSIRKPPLRFGEAGALCMGESMG